jgi:hypothetical protein
MVKERRKNACVAVKRGVRTGNLSIISTISQFESDLKMCTFDLI